MFNKIPVQKNISDRKNENKSEREYGLICSIATTFKSWFLFSYFGALAQNAFRLRAKARICIELFHELKLVAIEQEYLSHTRSIVFILT